MIIPVRGGEGAKSSPTRGAPGPPKVKNLEDFRATATLLERWLNRRMPSEAGRFDVIFIDGPGDLKRTSAE